MRAPGLGAAVVFIAAGELRVGRVVEVSRRLDREGDVSVRYRVNVGRRSIRMSREQFALAGPARDLLLGGDLPLPFEER